METALNAKTGEITVRYTDDDGKEKSLQERLDLPADIANGLLTTLVKDIPARRGRDNPVSGGGIAETEDRETGNHGTGRRSSGPRTNRGRNTSLHCQSETGRISRRCRAAGR